MKTNVNCRVCGSPNEIDIDEVLLSQFQTSIRRELETELAAQQAELNTKQEEYQTLFAELLRDKAQVEELVESRVKSKLREQEFSLKEAIRKEIDQEWSSKLQELEDELVRKSTRLKELNGTKAQMERLRREMEEKETNLILQKEEEFSQRLEEARLTIKEQTQQEHLFKIKEREKVIEDLKAKLEEARRKAEQGSMQLQGEIQELQILDLLKEFNPHDEIVQSKKGANAADILQVVMTTGGVECGKIYYESKRTKSFSQEWIKKFKQDNLSAKADILVLVTSVLPPGIERYGIIDGVWVCGFSEVKELSLVLRYGLLKVQSVLVTQQGKESKKELLYNYLTSEEFKNIFESILSGFKSLQDSHASEKIKLQRLWKEREKMLERVLANAVEFYGSIKGISSAIPDISLLDFAQAS